MSVTGNRPQNLALGINLGWIQQGAAFGGLPINEMTGDLERIRNHAGLAGYTGFSGYIDVALNKLNSGQPPTNIIPEINALVGLFQGGSSGQASQALSLGINLGWLQQGARAGNRQISLAIDDLNRVKQHAPLAGYTGSFAVYVDAALSKLRSNQPITAILGDVTALIGVFQGES
jgi:hypothetical protein